MKFYRSHGDVQFRGDLFVRPIPNHRMKYLFLPGAQRCGGRRGAPFIKERLRSRYQPVRKPACGRPQDRKICWFRTANQALHREQTCHSLDDAIFVGMRIGLELGQRRGLVAEKQQVGLSWFTLTFALNELLKLPYFLHSSLLPLLPGMVGCQAPRCDLTSDAYFAANRKSHYRKDR